MDRLSESGAIAGSKEPRTCRADVAPPPRNAATLLRGARAVAGALAALALGFASLLHAAETTVSQFAEGATWSLHGETSPVPGGTYTYTITRTAGPQPGNEYAGFHVPSTSTSVAHSNLGSNPMSCGAGKYFCASFSPSRGPGIWNNIQDHHTIYTEIFNNTTITATLAVTADTPIGTTITFGAIENNGRPRSGGLLLTVSTAPTKPPDPTPPTLVSATTKTLTIEWTHPGDGGSPLVRNYLHYRVQGTTEWSNWYAGETPVTRAAIGGLQANTAYEVRVSVTNARGSSEWVMGATAFSTRANTPATGVPTITGTAGVGQVLTASTTGISDADGLPATFSYQWVRVDADGTSNPVDIPGAIAATYTLTAPDVGKKLKVRVSFTDDLETTETLTSDAYPSGGTVTAAATCPVPDFAGRRKIWTAVLTMGDFTTQGSPLRGYGRFPDAGGDGGGLDPATFTIGLNEYAVEELAVDAIRLYFSLPLRAIWRTPATAALRLHVCNAPYDFSDSHYAWDGRSNVIPEHAWDTALDWSSVSTRTVHLSLPDNRSATGAPGITGTAEDGQVLGVDVTGIEDEDGLYDVEYAYQWVRVDADGTSNEEDISGATAATYTLTADDAGKKVKVEVSFTDDFGSDEQRPSAPTATVTAAASAVAAVTVPDFAGRRKIWTAVLTMGDFTSGPVSYRGYGRFPDAGGDGGGLDPAMFTIGLNEYEIEFLAVDAIRLYFSLPLGAIWRTPATAALRLHVCNAPYDFSDSHFAWDGRSNVIPEHAWDTALDWSSVSTRTVHLSLPDNRSATGAPVITGTAEVGQVLDVGVAGIEDEDGLYDVEYAYQWVRVAADGTSNEEDISGATAATYTLTADDVGKKVKVEMSFTDDFGSDEQRPSAPTATVTAAASAVCAVPSLSGRNVIWTGSMTVAVDPDNAGVFGFESGSFGTLDDQTFTVGTNDYRTRLVSLMGNVLTFATTNYDLTAEEKDVLRLHVCAADLDFSAAGGHTGDHGYVFSTTGLSWSSGDTVTLRLSLPATGQVMGVGIAPGNAHLVVTWTAVDTATGYTVQWRSGGEDYNTTRQATVTPGSTTRHTIPSLTNGTEYTVRVIATRTGANDGPPSAEVTGTPEPEPFEVEIVGVPDVAVTGESYELTVQSDEDSLVYAWRVDGGAIEPDDVQVDGGAIEPDDVQMVVWTAPETAGVAWIHVDVTREDGVTAGQSAYVRVEVPEPEPVPALPLLGQLLLALGLAGAGAMRLVRSARRP